MSTPYHLSYEFYYLLRTGFEHDGTFWQEPVELSAFQESSVTKRGMIVENDKRLFRWDAFTHRPPQSVSLEDWPKALKRGWKNVQLCYIEYFASQGFDRAQAEFFCNRALIGVALLINDADFSALAAHQIRIPLRPKNDYEGPTETVFSLVPENSPERQLLKVFHTQPDAGTTAHIPKPACLAAFHARFPIRHWQLRLDSQAPRLAPMHISPNASNPVFAVYGLAQGNAIIAQTDELQDFLVGEGSGILVHLIPRLMLGQWQCDRMELAANHIRQRLTIHAAGFNKTDVELRCLSGRKLSRGLQDMDTLQADAQEVLGNLEKALRTLDVHTSNIEQRLKRAHIRDPQFDPVWRDEAPLQGFDADVRHLRNSAAYAQGAMTCLDAIRHRWRTHFDSRQLALSHRLASLSMILAFIVAIGITGITASLSREVPRADRGSLLSPLIHFFSALQEDPLIADILMLLSNPMVYGVLTIILLLPALCFFIQMGGRKIGCWRTKLRQRF